jgi:hypothetical protein
LRSLKNYKGNTDGRNVTLNHQNIYILGDNSTFFWIANNEVKEFCATHITLHIIVSSMQGIYTYTPETNHVATNQSKVSNLRAQFHSVPTRFGLAKGHLQGTFSGER